jgi:hypothetical protein
VKHQLLIDYSSGIVTAGFLVCGLFFLKFWSRSNDFLFLAFAAAFWLLALNAATVTLVQVAVESRSWLYLIRVVAYLLIVIAIVKKNTSRSEQD